jgi:surface protein
MKFNQPIPFITENVTDMSRMFYNNDEFNRDISTWNVSNVINMSKMFFNSISFNRNLKNWEPTQIQDCTDVINGQNPFQVATDKLGQYYFNISFPSDAKSGAPRCLAPPPIDEDQSVLNVIKTKLNNPDNPQLDCSRFYNFLTLSGVS